MCPIDAEHPYQDLKENLEKCEYEHFLGSIKLGILGDEGPRGDTGSLGHQGPVGDRRLNGHNGENVNFLYYYYWQMNFFRMRNFSSIKI